MNEIRLNLVVIRSAKLEQSVKFYQMLGLEFIKHRHGNGKEHFSSEIEHMTFEIYPQKNQKESTIKTRIGFQVMDLESLINHLQNQDVPVIIKPTKSEWGLRAVIADPDGHRVELTQR